MNMKFKMITLIIVLVLSLQVVTIAEVQKYDNIVDYYDDPDFLAVSVKASDVEVDSATGIITFKNPHTVPSQKTDTNTYIIDRDTFIPNEMKVGIGEFIDGKRPFITFLIYILEFWEIDGNEYKDIHVDAIVSLATNVVTYQNNDGPPPNIYNLNVIEYFDGAGGNEYVTRGQMAYYICGLLNLRNFAENYQGAPSIFADVDESHEMSKYILLALDAGIVSVDTMFYPDNPVTYEQVLKMIVCALGYEPLAMSLGAYPVGYSTVADQNNITRMVDFTGNAPALRKDIARLLSSSLNVPLMEQIGFSDNPEYSVSEETIPTRYFGR